MGGRRTAASAPEQHQTKHTKADHERGGCEHDHYWMPDRPDPCRAVLRTSIYDQPDGECSLDVNHDGEHDCGYTGYRWRDGDRGAVPSNNPRAAS